MQTKSILLLIGMSLVGCGETEGDSALFATEGMQDAGLLQTDASTIIEADVGINIDAGNDGSSAIASSYVVLADGVEVGSLQYVDEFFVSVFNDKYLFTINTQTGNVNSRGTFAIYYASNDCSGEPYSAYPVGFVCGESYEVFRHRIFAQNAQGFEPAQTLYRVDYTSSSTMSVDSYVLQSCNSIPDISICAFALVEVTDLPKQFALPITIAERSN